MQILSFIPPKYRRFTVQSINDYVDAIVSSLKKSSRYLVLATIHEKRLSFPLSNYRGIGETPPLHPDLSSAATTIYLSHVTLPKALPPTGKLSLLINTITGEIFCTRPDRP